MIARLIYFHNFIGSLAQNGDYAVTLRVSAQIWCLKLSFPELNSKTVLSSRKPYVESIITQNWLKNKHPH
jgi:hypothetical protein